MTNLEFASNLYRYVGKTYHQDGREIQVLSLINSITAMGYVCVWKDTCESFLEDISTVGLAIEKENPLA